MLGFNMVKKKAKIDAPSLGGIIVILHHELLAPEEDRFIKFNSTGQKYTAESLCWHAAVKLNIRPIAFHLFSLYSLDRKLWLASNEPILVKDEVTQRFMFRIRLKLSAQSIKALHVNDKAAFDYFYLQCRNDLVNDEFVGTSNEEEDTDQWAKKCMGLGLIDATCALFQADIPPSQFGQHFKLKDFLAPVCLREYSSPVQKLRLQRNFKERVEQKHCDYQRTDADLNKLKMQFIIGGIYEYFPQYLVEDFKTVQGDTLISLMVDPFRGSELPGVFLKDSLKMLVSIQDILEIHIRPEGSNVFVQINRKEGMPEMLVFTSIEDARSFVSLLDKYYRMTEDYHVHVCKSVTSPMIVWMDSAKCHGPVTGKWAVSKLNEYNRHNEKLSCNYLIKQVNRNVTDKRGKYWNLEIVILNVKEQLYIEWEYNRLVENMWNCQCSLSVEGAPTFSDLQELISFYSVPSNPVLQLQRCLRPSQSKPVENRLLLCQRPLDSHSESINQSMTVSRGGVTEVLQDVTIVDRSIGRGKLTVIHKGTMPRHSGTDSVAVKQLRPEGLALLDIFTRSIHKMCFWSDMNIIHIRGIHMAGPFSIVEEYSAKGSISKYLCNPSEPVKVLHIVSAARQLASALFYLDEKKEFHGSVCCKNLLVFHHSDRGITVKLGDPGLVLYYNAQPLDHQCNRERLPWLAPELYTNLHNMSPASDMFAFGMTMWEMFSSGMRPYTNKPPDEIMQAARNGTFLEQPSQCPVPIFDLMKQCWNPDPTGRITARIALRNINSVEMNADDREYARPAWESEPQCQEVLDNRLNSAQIKRDNKEFLQQDMPRGTYTPEVNGGASQCDIGAMNGQIPDRRGIQARSLPLPPVFSDPLLIQENQLKMLNKLGSGYYGQVYLADFTKDGLTSKVAVKSLNSEMYDACVSEFEAEMKIMAKLDHQNIVSVIGKCPRRGETETMLIVMEYVENGCLREYLNTYKETICQPDLIRFAVDVAAGMNYLSSCKIIHNDLAARNVLVTNDRPCRAKISDFGLAKLLKPEQYYYKQSQGKAIPAFWCAPEAIQYHRLSQKSDVWSFGITLWEIYTLGKPPHLCKDAGQLLRKLHKGDRLNTSLLSCPEGIPTLMKQCWEYNSEKRPYFKDICERLLVIRGQSNLI